MAEIHIATIDGTSFAGKTTLLEGISHANSNIQRIEEYDAYAGGFINFPDFPPTDEQAARDGIDCIVRLDQMRTPDIRRKSADGAIVVTDRSVLSCILFQDTVRRLMPHIPNAYQYCLEAFLRAHDAGEVIFPNSLIYLEAVNVETFNKRVGRRGRTPIDFLSSEEAYYFTREWFSKLISQHYATDNSILLQSEDGRLDELVANAMAFLQNSSYQGDTRLMLETLLANCNRLELS